MPKLRPIMEEMLAPILALLCFAAVARGGGIQNVEFLFPPIGLTLSYMDTINVSYTSTFSKPLMLYTICTKVNSVGPVKKQNQYVPANNGSGLILLSWPNVESCYFDIRRNNTAKNGVRSHFVQVLDAARPTPIIVGLDQNSTTIPVGSAGIATATGAPSRNNGAKIGIVVGVVVGVVFITAAGFAWFFIKKRKSKNQERGEPALKVEDDHLNPDSSSRGGVVSIKSIPLEIRVKDKRERSHELPSERTFEIDNGRIVGEMSAESELLIPGPRRYSWERAPVS
ncbi:hypothetical protein QTJ16_001830 [Diplocarpon rosae]|uniref:Uncharacterized protein n=1 Tax=Diplocarpon rosae TaxID=946125 RepID=A0AAD9WEH7_9HELO|nr:hypothetical protein QTJ16_001830 [Diplocarpon rosae]